MAQKQVVHYKARDGLEIEAYLTLTKSHKPGEKLPTVIFPHGGPMASDTDRFDYWTQFFANRGYAVLQMNFRGSSDYGFDFMKAGLKGWGLAMQNDIEDGAHWMIAEGYTDPHKMCIVGASYGGYAAMMGAAKSPKLFRCAISFAGVSDLAGLVRAHHNFINYKVVKEQIGDDTRDLEQRSPVTFAKQIEIPVLLIHGDRDRNVRVHQSELMDKALLAAGKDVTYVELKTGDHYLSREEDRIATFKAMDTFLAKYLGP